MHQVVNFASRTASCRLSYAVQRGLHVIDPARSAGHALLNGISLGSQPSLHRLRRRRSFPRACSAASSVLRRDPTSRARRSSSYARRLHDARCGKALRAAAAGCGISRFPCEMFPRVRGVFDRAGSGAASPWRQHRCRLRHFSTASAPRPPAALAAGHGLRGSIPGPRVPLSTLRPHPHECARMTRGRRSWLSLQRMTLSFTTSRRF
jgi:hypothetical protein